uniref:WAP domain-containing protein n=1 Tax=Heterorhabditis bacteriophora TaxID=37862 RepID=A0A1I7XMI2_HETBA
MQIAFDDKENEGQINLLPIMVNMNDLSVAILQQCLAGTDTCWCVSPFGRRLLNADADCETRRRKQQNLARKAEKLREELRGGKKETCEVVRSGECPRVRTADNETMFCKCDSDCIGKEKCCLSQQGNICLLSGTNHSLTAAFIYTLE